MWVAIGLEELRGFVVPEATDSSQPDCRQMGSVYARVFLFEPRGCLPADCGILGTYAAVVTPELPDGYVVYSCRFRITPEAPAGRYGLPCLRAESAYEILEHVTTCEDGVIEVVGAPICPGDCNANVAVTIDEILLGVTIAMGSASLDLCPAMDSDDDGEVTIDDLMRAVAAALEGCRVPEEQAQQFP